LAFAVARPDFTPDPTAPSDGADGPAGRAGSPVAEPVGSDGLPVVDPFAADIKGAVTWPTSAETLGTARVFAASGVGADDVVGEGRSRAETVDDAATVMPAARATAQPVSVTDERTCE